MERLDNGLQGLDRPLLVVYPDTEPNPRRAKAARNVWSRIVNRTLDPTLKRYLTENDFETFVFDDTDRARRALSERLGEGDIRVVLALGEEGFRSVSSREQVLKLRGYAIPIQSEGNASVVVGTYSPDYILAGKFHLARIVQTDLLKAIQIGRTGVPNGRRSYNPHPSPEDAAGFMVRWVQAGRPPIAFDIETPWSAKKDEGMTFEDDESYTILMVSFCFQSNEAISFPWTPPYIDIAKAILRDAPQTLVWNAKFDVPRLMANGCEFGGEIIDAMLAWHWLEPSLPMGLKFVAPFLCPDMDAWVLGKDTDMALYNCGDSDVLFRAFQAIKDRLIEQGRWAVFERHFLKFGKILTRMTKRGINVDLEARRASRVEFENEFKQVVAEAQALAPSEVRPVHPKKGYKKTEAELKKSGLWVDGEMRSISVEISDEEAAKEAEKQERKAAREAARANKKVKARKRKGSV